MQGTWIRKPNGDTSVVFVHGILSNGQHCWRNRNGAYWPTLLEQELELTSLGLYVYTYQTGVYSGTYSIGDIVDDLKERLKLDKALDCQRIVFVCHSMGGIVVRKFIVERAFELGKQHRSIGLFLVASPSLGSDFANYLKLLSKLVGNAQAKALGFSQKNNWLNDLDKEFKNIKESGELNIQGKELTEDKPIFFKKLLKKQIVEPFSAAQYFPEPYKVPGSDHFSIAKPENNEAIQHRLLVGFIKKNGQYESTTSTVSGNAFSPHNQQALLNSQTSMKTSAGENAQEIKKWQGKLIQRLAEQLKNAELEPLTKSFASKLRVDFPELPQEWDGIASYLVMGQGDRHNQIAQFLATAQQFPADRSTEEALKTLMAYLLQILVRKCHEEEDKGLSRITVDKIKSVKLVAAARTTVPHIPSDNDNLEFEHGQKNEFFQNIGIFIPETGQLGDVNEICQVIVKELLKYFENEPDAAGGGRLFLTLKGQLNAYKADPEKAPVQGLFVKKGVGSNPLQRDDLAEAVAKVLRQELGDLLWVYLYGGQDSKQWLYADEDDLDGLISRYTRDHVKQKPTQQNLTQENTMNSGIHLNNIGSNATVNIVTGTQSDSQVGQGNVRLSENQIQHLQQMLGQLKYQAGQADDVSKQDYAVIDRTAKNIETEVTKASGADKSVLKKAQNVLGSLKDIASIANTIEKISELLLPLIG